MYLEKLYYKLGQVWSWTTEIHPLAMLQHITNSFAVYTKLDVKIKFLFEYLTFLSLKFSKSMNKTVYQ